MTANTLRWFDRGERLASGLLGQPDCFAEHVRRHDNPHDDYLERISVDARRALKPIAAATEDAVDDLVVGKSIYEEFLCCERLDKSFVQSAHCDFPALFGANSAKGKVGTARAARSTGKCIPPTLYGVAVVPIWNGMTGNVTAFSTGARA